MTKLEIFCGTGGVGKSTLSASRALHLAKNQTEGPDALPILLITIDPSRRLKQLLGVSPDNNQNGPVKDGTVQPTRYPNVEIVLLNPKSTLEKMLLISGGSQESLKNNEILNTITTPLGGLIEILSLCEVALHIKSQKFSTIILDTAPGGHFFDFLESANKIDAFFGNSFIEAIQYLNDQTQSMPSRSLLKRISDTGIKKLIGYLEKVTQGAFVKEFLDALSLIFSLAPQFRDAVTLGHEVSNGKHRWYMVTSAQQLKSGETLAFIDQAKNKLGGQKNQLPLGILNRSSSDQLLADLKSLSGLKENTDQQNSKAPDQQIDQQIEVLKEFLTIEQQTQNLLQNSFEKIYQFKDSSQIDLSQQLDDLCQQWDQHD